MRSSNFDLLLELRVVCTDTGSGLQVLPSAHPIMALDVAELRPPNTHLVRENGVADEVQASARSLFVMKRMLSKLKTNSLANLTHDRGPLADSDSEETLAASENSLYLRMRVSQSAI